jgi:hypothetical protein
LALYEVARDDVFPILLLMGLTLLAIRGLAWNRVKSLLARGWLTYQGTVEFGSVEERRTRYGRYYVARIDCSYAVNGDYYSGYLERVFFRENSADRFVATMKGQMVFVRSRSSRPGRSALLKPGQPGGWLV